MGRPLRARFRSAVATYDPLRRGRVPPLGAGGVRTQGHSYWRRPWLRRKCLRDPAWVGSAGHGATDSLVLAAAESFRRTALVEDGLANWPQSVAMHRPGRTALLVQQCHGAPGMVTRFAGFPDASVDD